MHCTQKCCSKSTAAGDCDPMRTKALLTPERICILDVATTNVRGDFFRTLDRRAVMRAASKAPQRKRPCRSRALPVDPSSSFQLARRHDLARVKRGVMPRVSYHAGSQRIRNLAPIAPATPLACACKPELSRCAKARPLSRSGLGQLRFRAGAVMIAVADTRTHRKQRNLQWQIKEQRADGPKTTGNAANS